MAIEAKHLMALTDFRALIQHPIYKKYLQPGYTELGEALSAMNDHLSDMGQAGLRQSHREFLLLELVQLLTDEKNPQKISDPRPQGILLALNQAYETEEELAVESSMTPEMRKHLDRARPLVNKLIV